MVKSDESVLTPWTLLSGWLPAATAAQWRDLLDERLSWQQPIVQVYGRRHPVPRKTVFLAAEGLHYRYSGTNHRGKGWPSWFIPLLDRVNKGCDSTFNGCLLNLYRDGEDRMGWHADDEPEIDQQQPIASLSLGATRDFCMRHRLEQERRMTLPLADGDLLIMHPGCQQHWMHGVPIRKRIKTSRINLTFRCFRTT
jgi:alkylated DNA repair dioxygenase AlkB